MGGKLGALHANVGNGHDLPKGGARQRADGVEHRRGAPSLVDDGANGIDVDADAERIWPRQFLHNQLLQKRIGRRQRVGVDAGTFGHFATSNVSACRFRAGDMRGDAHLNESERLRRDDAELARGERLLDELLHLAPCGAGAPPTRRAWRRQRC